MAELKKDETKRMLGRQRHTCRICGAEGEFETCLAREMMQGTREEFEYFACGRCRCLQIAEVPENLGDYYGEGYYSMQVDEHPDIAFDVPVSNMKKVLDVGCGAGAWLLQQAASGWGNLHGCDPFLDHDRHYGDRVHIRSCTIHEVEGDGTFDIIRMSDSFEHMADPLEALKSARRLLKGSGILRMTIPTWPNIAFDEYGPHWYQLDAPRHIFLHSKESLDYLAKAAGLMVYERKYNSNSGQFVRSYFYLHGIPYWEQMPFIGEHFTEEELERLERESDAANGREYGDHMQVSLRRSALPEAEGKRKAVYQKFRRNESRYACPYPPVYREPDADYLCFTTDEGIHSEYWKVRRVESLDDDALEPHLAEYGNWFELLQNQIQMGSVFNDNPSGNVVAVPSLGELPLVKLDMEKFEPTADENGCFRYEKNPVYQKGKYKGRPLLLTIGVPVSNQIGTIERCLSSIKPLLDRLDAELVAIDTGSTDGTIEVCRKYGARVYGHPWHDNMSAVRNEALRHARGLWYMSIDDDEWFEDVDDILRFFQTGAYRRYSTASYIQRNYYDSQGKSYGDHHTRRMAEVTPDLHFEGRIHDALVFYMDEEICYLDSYAHHYGFANDQPQRMHEKFLRNTAILLQDVYEYPENLRYLFQLANEYMPSSSLDTALTLFTQCLALAAGWGNAYRARISAMQIISCLHKLGDERLFDWAEYLEDEFGLITAERASAAWHLCDQSAVKGRPVAQVMSYFDRYERLLREYREDKDPAKADVFNTLAHVENDCFIMPALSIGFCASVRAGDEGRALEILDRISLDDVGSNRIHNVLRAGLAAGDDVYNALMEKLTPEQWKKWSGLILDAAALALARDDAHGHMAERLPSVLSRISASAVILWFSSSKAVMDSKVAPRLEEYSLAYARDGRIFDEETSVQELAFCHLTLKGACLGRNESREVSEESLRAYIMAAGAFMERYYSSALLADPACCAIEPEDRAAYRMAAVLADGSASGGNIALLKQALEIYPGFHEEIRGILKGLR